MTRTILGVGTAAFFSKNLRGYGASSYINIDGLGRVEPHDTQPSINKNHAQLRFLLVERNYFKKY
jgi:hypothetical protein